MDFTRLHALTYTAFSSLNKKAMDLYAMPVRVQHKEDGSPVSSADIELNTLITQVLKSITPTIMAVSEENYPALPVSSPSLFWLIDPIDGTRAFISKKGVFTLNAGLIYKGCPLFGVVASPLMGDIYIGSPLGAFKNGWKIYARRVPSSGATLTMSKPRGNSITPQDIADKWAILHPVADCIYNTSSIKICAIAEGRADFYASWHPLSSWDTAAAHAVLRYAGGSIVDINGQEVSYCLSTARNPDFLCRGL